MMKKLAYPLLGLALGSSVACTNMTKEQQGTFSGWTGAAIGGVAGAVAGNIKGREAER